MANNMNTELARAKALMTYHAKRCPDCHVSEFTSNNSGDHFCFCGCVFSDETALPSIYELEKQVENESSKD